MDGNRLLISHCRRILTVRMSYHLIIALYFCCIIELLDSNIIIGISLAAKLVRSSNQPTILVNEELMYTNLMLLTSVHEAGMVNDECSSLMVYDGRVMSLSQFGIRHGFPLVVTEEFHTLIALGIATEVEYILAIHGINARRGQTVLIRSVRFLRAENTNLIATGSCQTTITHKEIIILAHLLDIASLAGNTPATSYLLAEIGVAGSICICCSRCSCYSLHLVWVGISIVTKTILLVKFNHEDACKP